MKWALVTWDESDIQTIDEYNFESTVVNAIADFFGTVNHHRTVEVGWSTTDWDHGLDYKISEPPVIRPSRKRCLITIVNPCGELQQELRLCPSEFAIVDGSTDHKEELTFLQLRYIEPPNK